jgi:SAM-dependent methyltransferase
MAYYDRIAKQWHDITGYAGGAFKELVLNDVLLRYIPGIAGRSILELGAGNGYFLPLVCRRFSGQRPASVVITDQSEVLLSIARKRFAVPAAEYRVLDVRKSFPFGADTFDIILASMLFNEVPAAGLRHALGECRRVMTRDGLLLMTVLHPDFVASLQEQGVLRRERGGLLTMPGAGRLRLPVVVRSLGAYRAALAGAGFQFEEESVFPGESVVNIRPGMRYAGQAPVALVFRCGIAQTVLNESGGR